MGIRHLLLALASTLLGAPALANPPAPPSVRAVPPSELPTLNYWPFTPAETPVGASLSRIDVDATVSACGAMAWSDHPVPGSRASGPFCVGLVEVSGHRLLAVGRPGEQAYLVVPSAIAVETNGATTTVRHQRPVIVTPALGDAIRAWAQSPEAHR